MKLELHPPLATLSVNQPFGVNGEYYRANGINILGHNGIDFQAYHGQPVYASIDGMAYYEVDNSGGHGVVIVSDESFDYKGKQVRFKVINWHFCDGKKEPKYASPITTSGVWVRKGDLIGFADSTGLSSGDHLHYGLKPVVSGKKPTSGDAPDTIGDFVNVEQNNGYLGSIDPAPFLPKPYQPTGVVTYEQALVNLANAPLTPLLKKMVAQILKIKYKRG